MGTVSLTGIRAVVFDLDDTLFSERLFAFSGFDAVSGWLCARMECRFDMASRMRELFETGDRRHVFDVLLGELGCEETENLVPAMVEVYQSHKPVISLYDDAKDVLRRWRGIFQLGLISDGPEIMQRNKIEALGVATRLDCVILTDRWGRAFWKPHMRAFEEMESVLGVSGGECVYVADNVAKDFVAPRHLGWRSVCVRRRDGIYADSLPADAGEPEYIVVSLRDIELSL